MKNQDNRTGRPRQSAPDGRRRKVVDLLLIGVYVVIAVAVVIGVILFMLWGLGGN